MKNIFVLFFSLFFIGCPDEPVKPTPTNPLQLSVEDVSCTEAWLKVSLSQSEQNRTVTLQRNDSTIATITMTNSDSLFTDEGLLPNKTYTYTVAFGEWSASAQVTTMDTTSSNWNWEITMLGDGNGSSLYDIAIINDTLAYAVGEISVKDPFGNYQNPPYNIAKWNGQTWELITLYSDCRLYYPNCGPVTLGFSPGKAVFAFGPNDIWITAGNIFHWDGTSWTRFAGTGPENGNATKIWGDSSSGLYFVGSNGFMAHRSPNGSWQKIESGTTLNLYDIWGDYNERIKEYEILAVGGQNFPPGKILLQIKNSTVIEQSLHPIQFESYGIWFISERHYYLVGDGIYEKYRLTEDKWKNGPLDFTQYHTGGVRGNALNDLIVVGSYGECLHFNGKSWRSYKDDYTNINGVYGEVKMRGNLSIAVGFVDNKACVAIGKR